MSNQPDTFKSFSLNAMTLPWAPDWDEFFGRKAPLLVEIGFGHGRFLVNLAQKHPDCNVIGIERAHNPLTWAESRVQREGLTEQIRIVNGNGLMALACLFRPNSVSQFHINFSDPWHKKRHRERRLISPLFLSYLVSRLEVGGLVYAATDIVQYAGEIGLAFSQTDGLENTYPSPWMMSRDDPSIVTHYEKKAIQAGRPCHYLRWQRTDAAIKPPSELETMPMPNVQLYLPIETETIISQFEKMTGRYDDRVAAFLHVYHDLKANALLFEVTVEEPLFSQRLMLSLLPKPQAEHEFLLRTAPVGYPRPTRGVHDAVYHLTQWLLSLSPDAKILLNNVREPTKIATDDF